jgi:hypothetical protein
METDEEPTADDQREVDKMLDVTLIGVADTELERLLSTDEQPAAHRVLRQFTMRLTEKWLRV